MKNVTKTQLKDLVYQVNGAAIEVHKRLGPGLLETVYHQCLIKELEMRNINSISECNIPINYKGFDLSILTTYSIGGKMLDGVYNSLLYSTYVGQAAHVDRLNKAWKKPGDLAEIPRIDPNGSARITRTSESI